MRDELTHQRHTLRAPSRWLWRAGQVALLTVMALAALLLMEELRADAMNSFRRPLGDALAGLLPYSVIVRDGLLALVTVRTLLLGANSLSREQTGRRWEALVLGGADARQIVLGKWWATIRRGAPLYLTVAVIRAGLAVAEISLASRLYARERARPELWRENWVPPTAETIATAALLLGLFTVAHLLFTAAAGVWGGSRQRSLWAAIVQGGLVVLALWIVPRALIQITELYRAAAFPMSPDRMLLWWLATLSDTGLTLANDLTRNLFVYGSNLWMDREIGSHLIIGGLSLLVYGAAIRGMLGDAQRASVRRGATPPGG